MKRKSFIKKTVRMMGIQILLVIVVIVMFVLSSYRNITENMNQMLENITQIYGNELENKINNGDRLLEQLVYNNSDYQMLQSESETDRYYASLRIRDLLNESMISDSNVDMIVVAEHNFGTCIDVESRSITSEEKKDIRQFALECVSKEKKKSIWRIEVIGETPYVYRAYVWNGRMAAVFMKVDNFMENAANSDFDNMVVLLTDTQNQVFGRYGNAEDVNELGRRQKKYSLAKGTIYLYTAIGMPIVSEQFRNGMILFLCLIGSLLIFSFMLILYLNKEILQPMKHMQESMERIQSGDYELRIEECYSNHEFTLLKDTFNKLMDEIMGLKIKSYEKQIELNEAELKAIKLQIRPHFFLNAMTTISSLSMQNRNQEIKIYIDALAKNVRYMFKSGLHTVSLSEEIQHVENYFEMQELKYPGCVFYFIEAAPELGDWKIPQMLIHTIIENEYKYAVSIDSMLTILIKASKVTHNNQEMLLIEIEDDGNGYPIEIIEQLKQDRFYENNDGERVGLKSIKKMLELMYEQDDLFEITNIVPHGCLNRFYVPKEAVHEVKHDIPTIK